MSGPPWDDAFSNHTLTAPVKLARSPIVTRFRRSPENPNRDYETRRGGSLIIGESVANLPVEPMPHVHTTSFGVHHYDLDAFAELRASSYARLLQQAATEASVAVGYPDEWYAREGTFWLVRRTTIEYLRPVVAADTLQIRTWVTDFRRVRSLRDYEVSVAGAEGLVARASTDWVYVDRATGRPIRIPERMTASFMPASGDASKIRATLRNSGVPAAAFASVRAVEFRDLDGLGHVNNASYLDYVEQTAIDAAAAVGWPLERMLSLGGCWRPSFHDIEYFAEARYGDRLRCVTWVTAVGGGEIERRTEIQKAADGQTLVRACSRWRWAFRRNGSGKAAEIPTELARSLDAAIVAEPALAGRGSLR